MSDGKRMMYKRSWLIRDGSWEKLIENGRWSMGFWIQKASWGLGFGNLSFRSRDAKAFVFLHEHTWTFLNVSTKVHKFKTLVGPQLCCCTNHSLELLKENKKSTRIWKASKTWPKPLCSPMLVWCQNLAEPKPSISGKYVSPCAVIVFIIATHKFLHSQAGWLWCDGFN